MRSRPAGFALIPVVLALSLIGAIAFLLTRLGAMEVGLEASSLAVDQARYVAEAGFQHERWRLNQANCSGYTNLPSTPFGSHTYSATVTPTQDSPVSIVATGILAGGTTRTRTRIGVRVFTTGITTVLKPASKDNWLRQNQSAWNHGVSTAIRVKTDDRRALLSFDLSTIPVGASITSAILELYLETNATGTDVPVHRVTRSWVEGTGDGAASDDGATWSTYDGVNPWATAGGDYDATPAATTALGPSGFYTWDLTSLVSDWTGGAVPKEGLLLRGIGTTGQGPRFTSSNSTNATRHPELTVVWEAECGTGVTAPEKMYWVDLGQIRRADLDGSNVEDLVTTGLIETEGIDLDVIAGKMYWTDHGTDKVQRANLDGTVVEDLVDGLGTGKKVAIALDIWGGKMYYTDVGLKEILRANLDGTNIEALVSGLVEPRGIALDLARGKMYWTDEGNELIQRANLDGSNIENLVTTPLVVKPRRIELDPYNGKMYWADGGAGKIQRANLDGTVIEDLVTGLGESHGITLDAAFGGKIYWTDKGSGKIQRANLNGSNIEDLVTTGLDNPRGIALD